jgi:WD40 repeat protein
VGGGGCGGGTGRRPHAITGGGGRTSETGSDWSVRVWDLTTGTQTRELIRNTVIVKAVAVVELDGQPHAITGGDDRSVRVWDLTTGSCLATFHFPDDVAAVTASDDATVVGFGHEMAVLSLASLEGRFR